MKTKELLQELRELTERHIAQVKEWIYLDEKILNHKDGPDSWSVLECIEHLHRYACFYHPEIRKRIQSADHDPVPEFRSGWLGNYFAQMMLPKEGMKKIRTFADMNPNGSKLNVSVLETFIRSLEELPGLLDAAARVNLNKVKTSISISRWIRLKLGDTLRVVIYHNQRHIRQAEKVLSAIGVSKNKL